MEVLTALAKTLLKMFAADIGLTASAVAVVALVWLGRDALPPSGAPWLLAGGVLCALVVGVVRGARRR